jgi:acetylornithine aminotransferase/acetylornithine/N-succinyldiaminopimelate aminotransferase
MKHIVPPPPPIVHNQFAEIRELFDRHVVPSYGRFELALTRGQGSYLWDGGGRRYLDLGGGIAVNSLGHAHPEITDALVQQSQRLVHVSNLYYQEPQGRLAERIARHIAPGKVFFCNSGAEANEGLYKLARKFGHAEGRFEILTAFNSFHGRTLAGIAATGQEKVRHGFEPVVPGFRHVPFNDLDALKNALSPATVAVLIEGIQGEGGVTPACPEYLMGLRRFCDENRLLLMMDAVQCGHFRTGRFQSFQRILEGVPGSESFLPDAVSMAKSLGGGFPIGAFWVRDEAHGVRLSHLFSAGSHGTTFGGTPLGCAVALRILEIIERDHLADNVRTLGDWLKAELQRLVDDHPAVLGAVRGLGFMIGVEVLPKSDIPAFAPHEKPAATQLVLRLHETGVLTIPAGPQVFRLLPPLNLSRSEAEEGLAVIEKVVKSLVP